MKIISKGFTLIEMIIVIGIIGILSTIAFIMVDNPSEKLNAKKTKHDVAQIVRLIEQNRVTGYGTTKIATEIAKLSMPIGEKVAGSIPYLADIREEEFCDSGKKGYKYLVKLNNDSDIGNNNALGDSMAVPTGKKILCKSKPNSENFVIAAKITDTVWACGGYYSGESDSIKYFTVGSSGTLVIGCTGTFLTSEAEEY